MTTARSVQRSPAKHTDAGEDVQPVRRLNGVPAWTLGDRLRKIRRELGLSQGEFARMLGAHQGAYSAWETGRANPSREVTVAKRVELATGVPAGWVLGLYENGPQPDDPAEGDARLKGFEPLTFWFGVRRFREHSRDQVVTPLRPAVAA